MSKKIQSTKTELETMEYAIEGYAINDIRFEYNYLDSELSIYRVTSKENIKVEVISVDLNSTDEFITYATNWYFNNVEIINAEETDCTKTTE